MTIFDMLVLDQIDSIMASYNSPMQSVAEDVEYEDVSECETKEERAEKAQIIRNNE